MRRILPWANIPAPISIGIVATGLTFWACCCGGLTWLIR